MKIVIRQPRVLALAGTVGGFAALEHLWNFTLNQSAPETDDDIIATLEDAVHQTDQDFGSQPLHYGRSGSVAECAADALVSIDLHAHDDDGTDTARARAEETLDGLSAILSERTLHELRLVHRLEP